MRRFSYLLFLLLLVAAIDGFAKGVIKTEYMPASSFRDEAGNKLGSGDLLKFTGAYTLPFEAECIGTAYHVVGIGKRNLRDT